MQVQLPFTISDQARWQIETVKAKHEARINKKVVVAIMWVDSSLNNGRLQSQPALGFYDDRTEIESDISLIDGLEVVFAVSDDEVGHFRGKILDFSDGRFIVR